MKIPQRFFLIQLLFLIYIIGGFCGLILSIMYNFHKEHFTLAFLLGSILSIIILKQQKNDPLENHIEERSNNLIRSMKIAAYILFTFFSLISILIFYFSTQENFLSLEYFVVVSLSSTIILMQIIYFNERSKFEPYIILLEIFIISCIVCTCFLFLFPGPAGNDASYHIGFIDSVLSSGNFQEYPGIYMNYPGFHLIFINLSLLTGLSSKILQLVVVFIQIFFLIFVFLLTKQLINVRTALLSTLILSLSPYLILPRIFYYPSGFAVILFILALYLMFSFDSKKKIIGILLFLLSFVAILFTHPLTPVFIILCLIIILFTFKFFNHNKTWPSVIVTSIVSILTLIWWMQSIANSEGNENDLFSGAINVLANSIDETEGMSNVGKATLAQMNSGVDIMLNDIGFAILLFFGILGAFCIIQIIKASSSKKEFSVNNEKLLSLAIITLIFVPIPFLLAIIAPNTLPDRWFPFISVFTGIFAGFGILLSFKTLSNYRVHFLLIAIFFVFIFFMLTTPLSNQNSHIYAQNLSGRSSLTESEISGAAFINRQQSDSVHANSKYISFINRDLIDYNNFINPDEPRTYSHGLVVIRTYEMEKGFTIPRFGAEGKLLEIIPMNNRLYQFLSNSNIVYSNDDVKIYSGI